MAHLTNEPQEVTEVKRMLFHSGIQHDDDVVDTILTLQNQMLTEVVTEAKAICHHQGKRTIQPEHITFACGISRRRAHRKFSRLPAANLKKLAEHVDAKGWPEPSKKPTALRLPSLQNCLAQPTYVIKHDLRDENVRKKLADPTRGERRNSEPVPKPPDGHLDGLSSGISRATPEGPTHQISSVPVNSILTDGQRMPMNLQTMNASIASSQFGGSPYTAFSASIQHSAPSLVTYAAPQPISSAVADGQRFPYSRMPLMSTQQQPLPTVSMTSAPLTAANLALSTSNAGDWVNVQNAIRMMQQAGAIPMNRQPLPLMPQHMPQVQYVAQPNNNMQGFLPQSQNQQYYFVNGQGTFMVQSGPVPLGNDAAIVMPTMVGQPSSMAGNTFRAATSLPAGFGRQGSRDHLPINVSHQSIVANNNQVPVSVVAAAAVSVASNPTQDVNLDNIF